MDIAQPVLFVLLAMRSVMNFQLLVLSMMHTPPSGMLRVRKEKFPRSRLAPSCLVDPTAWSLFLLIMSPCRQQRSSRNFGEIKFWTLASDTQKNTKKNIDSVVFKRLSIMRG